ncbi:MAG: hypothetical protein COS85_06460, partial [Armatimonadetes bacterium CG07_land_8_20_14_0_80_59_28]
MEVLQAVELWVNPTSAVSRRIEEGLEKIARSCAKKKQKVAEIERRVGRLLGQNSRATGLFEVRVT